MSSFAPLFIIKKRLKVRFLVISRCTSIFYRSFEFSVLDLLEVTLMTAKQDSFIEVEVMLLGTIQIESRTDKF